MFRVDGLWIYGYMGIWLYGDGDVVWDGFRWGVLGEDRTALRGDSIIGGWRIADGDNGIKITPQQFG